MHLKIHFIYREKKIRLERYKKRAKHTLVFTLIKMQLPRTSEQKKKKKKTDSSDGTSTKTHMKRTLQPTKKLNTILSRTFLILLLCVQRKWNRKKNQFGIRYENQCFLLLAPGFCWNPQEKQKPLSEMLEKHSNWLISFSWFQCHFYFN